jgi:putative tricarboxylic transport membrane protein
MLHGCVPTRHRRLLDARLRGHDTAIFGAGRGELCEMKHSMTPDFLERRDVWAGVLLIAIGAAALLIARNYPFGSSLRMGPGYFPVILGALLIVFGLVILASGLRGTQQIEGSWSLRALIFLPLALVLFGVLMAHAGFVPAMLALIFASALASSEFNFVEVLLFSLGLTALCVAVFVWGLGLPYALITGLD